MDYAAVNDHLASMEESTKKIEDAFDRIGKVCANIRELARLISQFESLEQMGPDSIRAIGDRIVALSFEIHN